MQEHVLAYSSATPCEFPIILITNCHKYGGLKYDIIYFQKSHVQNGPY